MPKRWSKLQSRLYNLMDPAVDFQVHCALYEMNSNDGYHGSKLPRYFITVGERIVFDYPRNFDTTKKYGRNAYPWDTAGTLTRGIRRSVRSLTRSRPISNARRQS